MAQVPLASLPPTSVRRACSYRDVRGAAAGSQLPPWGDFLAACDGALKADVPPCRRSVSTPNAAAAAAAAAAAVPAGGATFGVLDPFSSSRRGGYDDSPSSRSSLSSFNERFARSDSSSVATKRSSLSSDGPGSMTDLVACLETSLNKADVVSRSASDPAFSRSCGDCGECDACFSAFERSASPLNRGRRASYAAPTRDCPNCGSSSGWRCGCADAALACDPGWVEDARCRIREAALELVEAQQRSAAHDEELTWLERTRPATSARSHRASFDASLCKWPGAAAMVAAGKPCNVEAQDIKRDAGGRSSFISATSRRSARHKAGPRLFSSMKSPLVKGSRVFSWLYSS